TEPDVATRTRVSALCHPILGPVIIQPQGIHVPLPFTDVADHDLDVPSHQNSIPMFSLTSITGRPSERHRRTTCGRSSTTAKTLYLPSTCSWNISRFTIESLRVSPACRIQSVS